MAGQQVAGADGGRSGRTMEGEREGADYEWQTKGIKGQDGTDKEDRTGRIRGGARRMTGGVGWIVEQRRQGADDRE